MSEKLAAEQLAKLSATHIAGIAANHLVETIAGDTARICLNFVPFSHYHVFRTFSLGISHFFTRFVIFRSFGTLSAISAIDGPHVGISGHFRAFTSGPDHGRRDGGHPGGGARAAGGGGAQGAAAGLLLRHTVW